VAGAFPDAAVGDYRLRAVYSLGGVESLQFFVGQERAILLAGLAPGNVAGAGDVAAALAGFGQARRSEESRR
jgi:hypothetical protein